MTPVIERFRPGKSYRHVVHKEDIRRFIKLLPDWPEFSQGLNAIVLDSGGCGVMGWYRNGVVAICGWENDLWWDCREESFHAEHQEVFAKLNIPIERHDKGYRVWFTERSARAFSLIHVFLHELGHHHDLMTTKTRRRSGRGEDYAESYAREREDEIIERYQREFGRF